MRGAERIYAYVLTHIRMTTQKYSHHVRSTGRCISLQVHYFMSYKFIYVYKCTFTWRISQASFLCSMMCDATQRVRNRAHEIVALPSLDYDLRIERKE